MNAAKATDHIGPSRFYSGSALIKRLKAAPLLLCIQDEFGAVLRSITDRRAGTYERQIGELMRSLWGVSFDSLSMPAWASQDDGINLVTCPAISILGLSTPEEFYAALQGESVDNGLLNRFLVLTTTFRTGDINPSGDRLMVPSGLTEALKALYLWSGSETLLHIADPA
jgi:hypothetical protein